ncbi:hypothetical protein [Caproiciproducens sp. LBM24188]
MSSGTANRIENCKIPIGIFNTFRKLWTQHVMWTRSFIISTAADLGDLQPVTNRLLRNPADFAKALLPYYGEERAKQFSDLLTKQLNDCRATGQRRKSRGHGNRERGTKKMVFQCG